MKKKLTAADIAAMLIAESLEFEYYPLTEAFYVPMPYGEQDRISYSSIYRKWFIMHDDEVEPLTQQSFDTWKYFAKGGCTYEVL
jgi:hypothetical protein